MASEKKIRASSSGDSHAQAVDALLQIMWNTKTFTLVQFIFISSCYIPTAFQLFCNIFSARPVKYECSQWNETQILQRYSNDSSVNVTATACSAEITDGQTGIVLSRLDCTAWTYPEGRGISLVSDFDLVCKRESLAPLLQSLFIAGQGIGALVFPALSDRLGRRSLLMVTSLAMLVFGLIQAFAPNYPVMAACKLLLGAFQQGCVLVSSTMIIEILPLSWRRHVFWLGIVSFSFSTVLLVPFAYFLRHVTWTVFLLVICSGSVFIVPMYLLVDETLVWLVANGKAQQAKRLLRRACRWNNEDEESVIKLFEESIEFYDAKITGESLCEDETDVRAPHHEDRQYNHFNEKDVTNDRELITAPHVYVDSPQKSPPPYSFINGCDNDNVQIRGLNEDGCLTPLKDTQKHCESKTTHFTTKGVSDSLVIQNILEPSHFITHIGGNQEREELHPGNKGLCESLLQRDPQSDKEGTFPNRLCVVSSMSGADSLADHEASAPILNESKAVEKAKSSNLLMMFKNRTLCLNIIAFWIIWIVDSFSFFMLFLTSGMLADDLYLNFLLNSLAELPSVLLLIIVPGWLGRRASLTSYHVLSGSLLLVATFIKLASDAEAAKICASAVSILGKIGVSSAFTFLFAYTPEAFPTNMRNFAVGSSSTAGRIGGALAPFVNLLPTSTSWLPSVVFGVVSLATCLLIQILPETRGKELPQTVDDVMDWYTTEKGSSDKSFLKLKSRKNQRKQSR